MEEAARTSTDAFGDDQGPTGDEQGSCAACAKPGSSPYVCPAARPSSAPTCPEPACPAARPCNTSTCPEARPSTSPPVHLVEEHRPHLANSGERGVDSTGSATQFLFSWSDPDVVELQPGFSVFVEQRALQAIRNSAKTPTAMARGLLAAVFSRHALLTCSIKGQKAKGIYKPLAQRPPLHPAGIDAILAYTKAAAAAKCWEHAEKLVVPSIATKLAELRSEGKKLRQCFWSFMVKSQKVMLLEKALQQIRELAVKGGANPAACTKSMLRYVMTDHLTCQFSWQGRKRKLSFCQMRLPSCITCAVQTAHEASDFTVEMAIREWLRHAPARQRKAIAKVLKASLEPPLKGQQLRLEPG
ncbi:hypothetical protein HPB52_008930 [Rhipicephalus sanguineus]|uniref:BEN domain-containing protein n=1 Tax=Rhipicephalus sanguineus TaxID=34632 RepID=A0A9D4Q5S6_RHISA|nr:hypothetical protein HPB52_008930 [Rhipicephalus sanguineus]